MKKRKREIIELDSESEEESDELDDADKEMVWKADPQDEDDEQANQLIMFGSGFDKAAEYDQFLDEANPWHDDLQKPSTITNYWLSMND